MKLALFLIVCTLAAAPAFAQRSVTSLDADWRFLNRDAAAPQEPEFNDSSWRKLDVPHDWSIEGPFAETNPSGGAGGYLPDGIGWYRKHFSIPDSDAQKRFFVVLDSVMANSDVWINGFFLGHRPYGYVELNYELTGHLNVGPGKSNVLAVRIDQERQPASRYYMGAGILGHVRLMALSPVHFQHNSIFISTSTLTDAQAVVHVQGTVTNQSDSASDAAISISLTNPDGQPAAASALTVHVAAGASADFSHDIPLASPKLWDLDSPRLYSAKVDLTATAAADSQTTSFGVRSIKFTPEHGFFLNGKNIRLQGVCLHADCSAFGAAVPAGAWERRLAALRPFGVNALRTAHNPPSPEFLDLCDRMGFLVMDEMYDCWDVAKNKYDYHLYFDHWSLTDLRDTVRRDRNHPSIILYSAGNEIHDTPNGAASVRILTGLVNEFHANDPTRPVTQALFRPNVSHDYDDGLADLLDVVGTNYRNPELLAAQQAKPYRTLVGTENHIEDITFLAKTPQLSGIFIWAGVDYLGEAFRWPQYSSGAGLFDRTDSPKAQAYYVATVWAEKPFVHIVRGLPMARPGAGGRGGRGGRGGQAGQGGQAGLDGGNNPAAPAPAGGAIDGPPPAAFAPGRGGGLQPDWTPANQQPHPETVTVYTNCAKVELTLNGAQLHSNPANSNPAAPESITHVFTVPYAPGTLSAVGYDASGAKIAADQLRTAGPAAKIILEADAKSIADDWDGVCFVRATVVDQNGIRVPSAADEISFAVSGPGLVAAVDSADPTNHEPFQAKVRKAYYGSCFAVIKANAPTGDITVTATAKGLSDGTARLSATPQ